LAEIWSRNAKFMNEYADLAAFPKMRLRAAAMAIGRRNVANQTRSGRETIPPTSLILSSAAEVRMAGAFFHVVNVACDVFVIVMMSDTVKPHLVVAGRAGDAVAMGDAADAFMKCRAAFGAAHANFQVADRIMHGFAPAKPCQGVIDGELP
jgi:hypothetical protein